MPPHTYTRLALRCTRGTTKDGKAGSAGPAADISGTFVNMILACRVRKDHYKGMSETERQAVLATQLAQMEERKAKQAAQLRDFSSVAFRVMHGFAQAAGESLFSVAIILRLLCDISVTACMALPRLPRSPSMLAHRETFGMRCTAKLHELRSSSGSKQQRQQRLPGPIYPLCSTLSLLWDVAKGGQLACNAGLLFLAFLFEI
eukprot:1158550-Pelagomonas_calceolata.AAC.1